MENLPLEQIAGWAAPNFCCCRLRQLSGASACKFCWGDAAARTRVVTRLDWKTLGAGSREQRGDGRTERARLLKFNYLTWHVLQQILIPPARKL